jgi:hypothetical protein
LSLPGVLLFRGSLALGAEEEEYEEEKYASEEEDDDEEEVGNARGTRSGVRGASATLVAALLDGGESSRSGEGNRKEWSAAASDWEPEYRGTTGGHDREESTTAADGRGAATPLPPTATPRKGAPGRKKGVMRWSG